MNEEKEIGKKAALMLQSSLRGETGKFGKHVRGDKNALQNAQAKPRYRTSKRMDGTKQQYLKGIAIVMGRHGFVLHYGIEKGLSQAETLAFASAVSAFAVSQSNVGVSDIVLFEPILANVKISVIEG